MALKPLISGAGVALSALAPQALELTKKQWRKRDKLEGRVSKEWKKWRKRRKRFGAGLSPKDDEWDMPLSDLASLPSAEVPEVSSRLEIVDAQGKAALALSEIPDPGPRNWKSLRGSGSPISNLNPLFSAIPSAMVSENVHRNGHWIVEIAGKPATTENLTRAADSVGYRAISKSSDGTISEHAKLFEAGRLDTLVSIASLWQIASAIVAQKYMHDINARLGDIQSKIAKVSEFQNDKRVSDILGAVEYIPEISDHIETGKISASSENKIESECVDLRKIEIHLGSDIAGTLSELEERDLRSTVEKLPNLVHLLQQMHICIAARLCGCRIMAVAGEDPNRLSGRLDKLRGDYRESFVENVEKAFEIIEESLLFSKRDGQSLLSDLKAVEKILDSLQDQMPRSRFEGALESFEEAAIMTRIAIFQRNSPEPLLVKVHDGKIESFSLAANVNREVA